MSVGFAAEMHIIVMFWILMAKEEAKVLVSVDLVCGTQVYI